MQRTLLVFGIGALLVCGLFAPPVVGSSEAALDGEADEPMFHVDLDADGDAIVSMVSVYDLTAETDREAFESIQADDEAQTAALERFADRLEAVAAEITTDREMTVSEHAVDVRTTDEQGMVTLAVTWEGLAHVDDETLVVTEPFASEFESDRTLIVTGPDGSTLESASPEPSERGESHAVWEPGVVFQEFEVVVTWPDERTTDSDSDAADEDDTDSDAAAADDDADHTDDDEGEGSKDGEAGTDDGDEDGETATDGTPGFTAVTAVLVFGLALGTRLVRPVSWLNSGG